MNNTLKLAEIIGFFSLPSPGLAEHNPSAYNNAMAAAPEGAGSCSQCGMGIMHHVVIRDSAGKTRFIGQDCAIKVGANSDQIRYRLTDDQRRARDARRAAAHEEWLAKREAKAEEYRAYLARRREVVGDIVDMLKAQGNSFHASLAEQLENRPLSPRQAFFVAKATSSTGRRNKQNAAAWDAVESCCQLETE